MGKIVVNGLIEKRAEIAGRIQASEQQIRAMRETLSHLDKTIHLFAPAVNLQAIRGKRPRTRNATFGRGERDRAVRELLRDAPAPMTVRQISDALLAVRNVQDAAIASSTCIGISNMLVRLEKAGQARRVGRERGADLWQLV